VSEKTIKALTEEITNLEKMVTALESKMQLNSTHIYREIGEKIEITQSSFDSQHLALSMLKSEISKLKSDIDTSGKTLIDLTTKLSDVNSLVSRVYLKSLSDEELIEAAKNGR
jgi:polyhydroxyalkanoate synthesis regulator phasin